MIVWHRISTKRASEAVKARREAISTVDPESEVCEGDVQLEIKPFESFRQINKYTKYLSTIENLRIVSENWSEEEGFNIIVSAQVPLALGRLLQDMPEVARVHINGNKTGYSGHKNGCKKMVVVEKTNDAIPEPVLV